MPRKIVRSIFLVALIVALALGSFLTYQRASQASSSYDIPRIMGMEGEADFARINGTPSSNIEGPFFETQAPAASLDVDLRTLPQTGPSVQRPMREMGRLPRLQGEQALDPVIQSSDSVGGRPLPELLAPAPSPIMNFGGISMSGGGAGCTMTP